MLVIQEEKLIITNKKHKRILEFQNYEEEFVERGVNYS